MKRAIFVTVSLLLLTAVLWPFGPHGRSEAQLPIPADQPILSPVNTELATTINIQNAIRATIIPGQRVIIDAPAALIATHAGFLPGHTEITLDVRPEAIKAAMRGH